MAVEHYDLIVIGSGPAGEKGAAQAAYFGKRVALIEKERALGGAAANTGTLPSKTLRESALYLSGFKHRGLFGVDIKIQEDVSAQEFLYRERLVVQTEHARIADNIQNHGIALYRGSASFVDPHTIEIAPEHAQPVRIQGDVILIATGSHPFRPPFMPFHDMRVYDSDTILNIQQIPDSMVIAGGGVIGCEYACMFSALGIQVNLIEGRGRLLGFMDQEVSATLAQSMRNMGIAVQLNDAIESVEARASLSVHLKSGTTIDAGALLAATGRSGNTEGLGLDQIGIEAERRGTMAVNGHYQTEIPHIYAVGDVIGFPALASTSMEQARVAMVHAFDLKYKTDVAHILPYGIYTIPECSMAGDTEESLQEKGIDYVVGRARYRANARGQIIGDDEGFLKLMFDFEEMNLLGVHIIGEQASELVHVGLTALLTHANSDLFIQTCYNYPTLSEVYKYATYDALGAKARRLKEGDAAKGANKKVSVG